MSARLLFLLLFIGIGIVFVRFVMKVYRYYSASTMAENGKSGLDAAINPQTRKEKLRFGELLVYLLPIISFLLFYFRISQKIHGNLAPFASAVLTPMILGIFNARQRNGRSMVRVAGVLLLCVYIGLIYAIVGLPPIAPTFSIDQTKIIPDQTTVSDLLKDGFDIYIGKKPKMGIKYTELLGEFRKYPEDRSVVVKKGLSMNNTALEYSPYLLVKDGVVLCSVGLYGSEKKDTVLEDCKIVHLKFNEDSIQAVRQKKIQCTFNGIDIFAPLNSKEMAKRFGKKIWLFPSENSVDTNGHYGISWRNRMFYLFWNEYDASIDLDEENRAVSFTLSTDIARDFKVFRK